MKKYLQLIRIKHWVKNILIFIPMLYGKVLNINNLYMTVLGFVTFSLASSFIYIVNDVKDLEYDKIHPTKKKRPIASGQITKKKAIIVAICLLLISLMLNFVITGNILNLPFYLLLAYIINNILYSFYLKNIVIIDVLLLTLGFILRIYYGGALINTEVSNWLFLTITSGALFLGLGKRKQELINNKNTRIALKNYNELFLEKFQSMFLTLTITFYALWAMEQTIKYNVYTVIIIIIIFMRYSLISESEKEGDPITIFYSDKPLIVLCLIYLIITMTIFLIL